MIVYGDASSLWHARAELLALRADHASVRVMERGHRKVQHVADLLVRAGMLVQGLLDAWFAEREADEVGAEVDACHGLLLALGLAFAGRDAQVEQAFERALALQLPDVMVRKLEGFMHYAVYPEQYLLAARASGLSAVSTVHVIGVRSIGTTLAAVVAGACDTQVSLHTVRPVGHPFRRALAVGPGLAARLLEHHEDAHYAVVDEGPGLSGSSFEAVLRWLGERGVPRAHMHLFPSHAGAPGAHALPSTRESYARTRRHVASFERAVVERSSHGPGLRRWFEDITGPCLALRELSGGHWRELLYAREEDYPPSAIQSERRKYRLEAEDACWLLRFLGLGPDAARLRVRGERLSKAGLAPPLRALRHGFTLAPWLDAVPLSPEGPRAALLHTLMRYLSFVAQNFPAPSHHAGASVQQLLNMAKYNVSELLGQPASEHLRVFDGKVRALQGRAQPVCTDNKLDMHEWLLTPEGTVLKSDALDHHVGHDLIGCQDPLWDVAGAKVELGLDPHELDRVFESLRDQAGLRLAVADLGFYEVCYLSFRAGQARLAAQALAASTPAEATRLEAASARYGAALAQCLVAL